MTSLGAWDTIETGITGKHSLTFPMAIVKQILLNAGISPSAIDVYEGDIKPQGPWDVILIGALDSRHFWKVPAFLRALGLPELASERRMGAPAVIIGGQACYAPGPVLPFVDVAYVGEAEVSLIALLRALDGGRKWLLDRAAEIPGCLVPDVHGYDHQVSAVYTDDPSISLRGLETVNLRPLFRIEIARGCPHRCPFCCLGWRQPYRPLPKEQIIKALEGWATTGKKEIHLQAGDAEAHPDIEEIRCAVERLGLRDHSWTGRLDTVRTQHATAGKQYAFGIEGLSERLRKKSGKRGYSNEFIARRMGELWRAGARKLMFHFIGGLPGETDEDAYELEDLFYELEAEAKRSGCRQYLQVGRQPFGPLPHTPWERKAPGLTHDRLGAVVERYRGGTWLNISDKEGQHKIPAILAAVTMRVGPEAAEVLIKGPPRLNEKTAKLQMTAYLRRSGLSDAKSIWQEWPKDKVLPWSNVKVKI